MSDNILELNEVIKEKGSYQLGKCYGNRGRVFYTIKNSKGDESNHAHFNKYSIACSVLDWVYNKKIPKSKYYANSCFRLTTDKIYKERLENHKYKKTYINVNKGVRT